MRHEPSDYEIVKRRQEEALRSIEELYAEDFWRCVMGTSGMSMVDGSEVRAEVRVQRLKDLKFHCLRRKVWAEEWAGAAVPDWGKWAMGPQEMKKG